MPGQKILTGSIDYSLRHFYHKNATYMAETFNMDILVPKEYLVKQKLDIGGKMNILLRR